MGSSSYSRYFANQVSLNLHLIEGGVFGFPPFPFRLNKGMKSFLQHVMENTTANMVYFGTGGAGFAVDGVPTDFDVDETEGELHNTMKPWEVRNAEDATTRRTHLLRWMKASSKFQARAVNDSSVPLTPDWQSRKR